MINALEVPRQLGDVNLWPDDVECDDEEEEAEVELP